MPNADDKKQYVDYLRYLIHFGHDNIIKFQQRPKNHESLMLANWIKRVRDTDIILHMGDLCMSKGAEVAQNWCHIISRLPGKKYLILGNHDIESGPVYEAYSNIAGFTIIPEFIQDGIAFTHRPLTSWYQPEHLDLWDINIHGHVHGNGVLAQYDGITKDGKRYINACVEATNYGPVQFGNLLR